MEENNEGDNVMVITCNKYIAVVRDTRSRVLRRSNS